MNIKFLFGVLILVLATCSIYSPTPRGSGIEGRVLLGPVCPVVQQGQDCANQPYQATLTVLSRNGLQIARVHSDAEGYFRASLVPGEYVLHPEAPNGIPFAADQVIIVETGRFTQITVQYDSGIR